MVYRFKNGAACLVDHYGIGINSAALEQCKICGDQCTEPLLSIAKTNNSDHPPTPLRAYWYFTRNRDDLPKLFLELLQACHDAKCRYTKTGYVYDTGPFHPLVDWLLEFGLEAGIPRHLIERIEFHYHSVEPCDSNASSVPADPATAVSANP